MAEQPANSRFLRRLVWLLAILALTAGCLKEHLARLRGPGFDEGTKRLTSDFPQRADEGKPFSFSTKAQEIERSFGYQ